MTRDSRMDILSKTVCKAVEELLEQSPDIRERMTRDGIDIILFNNTSSVVADKEFDETISDDDNFFPSPSLFIYTLPNICASEVAIKYHIQAETSFYILRERNEAMMRKIAEASQGERMMLYGWVDCPDNDNTEIKLNIIWKN